MVARERRAATLRGEAGRASTPQNQPARKTRTEGVRSCRKMGRAHHSPPLQCVHGPRGRAGPGDTVQTRPTRPRFSRQQNSVHVPLQGIRRTAARGAGRAPRAWRGVARARAPGHGFLCAAARMRHARSCALQCAGWWWLVWGKDKTMKTKFSNHWGGGHAAKPPMHVRAARRGGTGAAVT